MKNPQTLPPGLIVNAGLIRDLLSAPAPCFTLGLLEENNTPYAYLALRLSESILWRDTRSPFSHGYALLGPDKSEVVQFSLTFFESATYHVLVNPNNPVVHATFEHILDRRCYFVLAIEPSNHITAFRANFAANHVARLAEYSHRTQRSTTTKLQYQQTLSNFRLRPSPEGHVLNWVCVDNVDYLNLTKNRLDVFRFH